MEVSRDGHVPDRVQNAMAVAVPEPDLIGSLRIWAILFADTQPPELVLDLMTAADILERSGLGAAQ